MLPHTHFLFALLVGILAYYKGQITSANIIIIAILSTIIDIDHPIAYLRHHKKLSLKKAWNNAVTAHEHQRTIIHKPLGISIITISLFILLQFYPQTNILFLAYFSHMFLDYVHLTKEKIKKHNFINLFNILIPISPSEIAFDIILIISNLVAFYYFF